MTHKITLIPGDGIGPEVTSAAMMVADATGVPLEWEVVEAGEKVMTREGTPLPKYVLESLKHNKVGLKGPITTPIGSGFRSVNVAIRQELELFASVRPDRAIAGEGTRYPDVDLVVVREATEGLYSGVEHWIDKDHSAGETANIITRKASTRIIKFAFEYARKNGRKKVTAVHKANIMKVTGGLFQEVFQTISKEYPNIISEERLVDNMCMQLVKKPEDYDLIVTTNLFGDIISDLSAGLAGGLGVAPGALYGESLALFEPVHGSAPKYAGQDKADPVAEILCVELLLRHLGYKEEAERVFRAVWETIYEKKVVTYDLALPGYTQWPTTPSKCSEMGKEIARQVNEVDLDTPLKRREWGAPASRSGSVFDKALEV